MQFDFPKFEVNPICWNPHLQTVLSIYIPSKHAPVGTTSRTVRMQDGDLLVVHDNVPPSWQLGDRVVLMVHGLCGCHGSQYMMRISSKLNEIGFRTIRVDLRGFGSSQLVSRGHAHAGCSDDVEAVLEDTFARFPESPVSLVGFSFGANISLKLLGEYADNPPELLDSAAVVAPPIDLIGCAKALRKGINRYYDYYFVNLIKKAIWKRRRSGINMIDVPLKRIPNRLYDLDDQFTAPAIGFQDAEEYYTMCSAAPLLDQVTVPTLLITSKDDPIVPFEVFENAKFSESIQLLATDGGGHLGFFSKDIERSDRRWMDWRIVDWIKKIDDESYE